MMFKHLIVTFALLIYSHISLSEEKILTWSFEAQNETSFDLSIKGTWEDPGLAFWKDPKTVTVRTRLDITPGTDGLRFACSIELEFYDKDGFEVYRYKFRDGLFLLLSERSLNASWTMDYKAFVQIENAKLVPNLPRRDIPPEVAKVMRINGCSYDRS